MTQFKFELRIFTPNFNLKIWSCPVDGVLRVGRFFYSIQADIPWGIWITTNSLILLYYVCERYKYNSDFGAGCPNWADLKFGFVHSTDIIEQNKSVYHNQDTSTYMWWTGIENLFLKRHLMSRRSIIVARAKINFSWMKKL